MKVAIPFKSGLIFQLEEMMSEIKIDIESSRNPL